MTKYRHRVETVRATKAPRALPKEVTPIGERQYINRWGDVLVVVWGGSRDDGYLRDLSVNRLK